MLDPNVVRVQLYTPKSKGWMAVNYHHGYQTVHIFGSIINIANSEQKDAAGTGKTDDKDRDLLPSA